jgi:uncharacterized membrane protein YbhN (UPF0104 family)
MVRKLVSLFQYVLFFGLGIFLVWWSLQKIDEKGWSEIRAAFATTRYTYILPACLALLVSHYSRAIRWKMLMEPLGYTPKMSNTYIAVLIGYLANLALPRLGEVLKCTMLARYEKIAPEKLIGTIVAERAFDLICLMLIIAIAFFAQMDVIGAYMMATLRENVASRASGHLNYLIGGIILFALMLWLTTYILRKFAHLSFMKKISAVLNGIWHGLTSIRFIKNKGAFLAHSLFIWGMYLVSIQMGMYALKETEQYGLIPSLSVLATGSIAMILTPSGIGAYPLFLQETMSLYGVRDSIGIAFGWLLWTVQFFQVLIAGFIGISLLPYFNKIKINAKQ